MKISRGRLLVGAVAVAGGLFALQGGQYSTLDLLRHRSRKADLVETIDSLRAAIDSLEAYKKVLASDPREQERVAREMWGMVKANEILYRIRDSAR